MGFLVKGTVLVLVLFEAGVGGEVEEENGFEEVLFVELRGEFDLGFQYEFEVVDRVTEHPSPVEQFLCLLNGIFVHIVLHQVLVHRLQTNLSNGKYQRRSALEFAFVFIVFVLLCIKLVGKKGVKLVFRKLSVMI